MKVYNLGDQCFETDLELDLNNFKFSFQVDQLRMYNTKCSFRQ